MHFQSGDDITSWLAHWQQEGLPTATRALAAGLSPVVGFSFYTWNAAEFLALAAELKRLLPTLLVVAGGPHVQQAGDYLGVDPIDVIFLGEAEVSFQEFLDCQNPALWTDINGLAFLAGADIVTTRGPGALPGPGALSLTAGSAGTDRCRRQAAVRLHRL